MRGLLFILLALALLGPGASAGHAEDAGAADVTVGNVDGPHLLVEVTNRGGDNDATLTVTAEGRVVYSERLTFPGGSVTRVAVEAPEGQHLVDLEVFVGTDEPGEGFGATFVARQAPDTTGCIGAFLAPFQLSDLGVGTMDGDCLAAPPAYYALLEEAREARALAPSDRGVAIPVPGVADRGEYLEWALLAPPQWSAPDARHLQFRYENPATFPDSWGRLVTGTAIHVIHDEPASRSGFTVNDNPLRESEANVSHLPGVIHYLPGNATAFAHTLRPTSSAFVSPVEGEATYLRTHLHSPPEGGAPCLLRHAVQGGRVTEGARIPAAALCLGGLEAGAEWVAGRVATIGNRSAIPLYQVTETPAGTRAARVWLAEGVAYPVEADSFTVPAGCCATRTAYRLHALAPAGEPIPTTPASEAPPAVSLELLAPLDGPALTDAARAGVPFPLDEASRAARADPRLAALQALAAKPEAALAGAIQRAESPASPDGPLRLHWVLAFTHPDAPPVLVRCVREALPTPVGTIPAPVASCEELASAPDWAREIADPPRVGASALPVEAVSWDTALTRWREGGGIEAATYLLYRAWNDPDALAPPAAVESGTHFPLDTGAPRASGEAAARHTRLALATGRTLAETTGESQVAGLDSLPPFLAPAPVLRPGDAAHEPGGLPLFTPAVAVTAAGILAALLLALAVAKGSLTTLYTRLTRSTVLDLDARNRVFEAVRAEPGIHALALAERLGESRGGTEYHLKVLTREGFLTVVDTPGFRRYFVAGTHSPREMRAAAALRAPHSEQVFRLIQAAPGVALTEVAVRAGISKPQASKIVARLVEAGLVERVREGRTVSLRAQQR